MWTPEDLQMHYTRMLCYARLGRRRGAGREQALFQRFKAEESAQAITAKPRLLSPENNNERQQIHDHESVPLNAPVPKDRRLRARGRRPMKPGISQALAVAGGWVQLVQRGRRASSLPRPSHSPM
jgi:hypothetical protein